VLTLSSDLTATQQAARRKPALLAYAHQTRFAVPNLNVREYLADTSGDADCQLALAVVPTGPGSTPLAVRNNAGSLDFQADYPNTASWTNLDTVTAGQGFALAYDPVAEVFGLATATASL
jgi:hypothetical protein